MSLDLNTLGLPRGPEHTCPYLEDRLASERAFRITQAPESLYRNLMDWGWRRSGHIIYKPACRGCSECVPIRVPVAEFRPNRSQRRIQKRNADLTVSAGVPEATQEKFDLFVRYQESRHTGDMCTKPGEFRQFLYESPVDSREFVFRLDGEIACCAIVDVDAGAMSAVYTWFRPELEKRGLGIYAILWSIGHARNEGLTHYYMGYHIEGCRKMNYKTRFRPCELGDMRGRWRRADDEQIAE